MKRTLVAFTLMLFCAGQVLHAENECGVVDLSRPYGSLVVIQQGDVFYVTVSGMSSGSQLAVDQGDGVYGISGGSGEKVKVSYDREGYYTLSAAVDGVHLVSLSVNVIASTVPFSNVAKDLVVASAATVTPSFGVGSVYAGNGKFALRLVAGAAGTYSLVRYGAGAVWSGELPAGDTIIVLDGPSTSGSQWTLIKYVNGVQSGGTHVLSPDTPYRLKIGDIMMKEGPEYAPVGEFVAGTTVTMVSGHKTLLEVSPDPWWTLTNSCASLFVWSDNGQTSSGLTRETLCDNPTGKTVAVTCGTDSAGKSVEITPVALETLTLSDASNASNCLADVTGEDTTPEKNTLYVLEDKDGKAAINFSLTYGPDVFLDEDFGGDLQWKIEEVNGGDVSLWSATSGNFNAQPCSAQWTKGGATCPREYRLRAWLDINGDGSFDSNAEPSRMLRVTVVQVESVTIRPKNPPPDDQLPDPVRIAAGALDSDAHLGDVVVQIKPALAGISIPMKIDGGVGHAKGFEAKLTIKKGEVTGGGVVKEFVTQSGGVLSGVLRSSDVLESCRVWAGPCSTEVLFNWDDVAEEDSFTDQNGNGRFDPGEPYEDQDADGSWTSAEWVFAPEYLPASGPCVQTLRFRHHRNGVNNVYWKPLIGHEIRFFVEEVFYFDKDGNEVQVTNTAANPTAVNDWAEFPANGFLTDNNGLVSATLTVKERSERISCIRMSAYDWTVWKKVPDMQKTVLKVAVNALSSTTATADKDVHVVRDSEKAGTNELKPAVLRRPVVVRVLPGAEPKTEWDYMRVYLATPEGKAQTVLDKLTVKISLNGKPAPVPTIKMASVLTSEECSQGLDLGQNGAATIWYAVAKPGKYTVEISVDNAVIYGGTFEFQAVGGRLTFDKNTGPIIMKDGNNVTAVMPLGVYASTTETKPGNLTVMATITPMETSVGVGQVLLQNPHGIVFKTKDGVPYVDVKPVAGEPASVLLDPVNEGEGSMSVSKTEGRFVLSNARVQERKIILFKDWDNAVISLLFHQWVSKDPEKHWRLGYLEPLDLVCADMDIVTPDGDPQKAGDGGANSGNEAVFDDELPKGEKKGTCLMKCAGKSLSGLKGATRKMVWDMMEWRIQDAGNVTPTYGKVKGEPHEAEILYGKMPERYDAFGSKTLTLRFKDRPAWAYYQPVELFFHATGKSASENGGANVKKGNPNWYVYWPQIAAEFGFGPQTTVMVYDKSDKGKDGQSGDYVPTVFNPWKDKMTIYNINCADIVQCIKTIHHENGHRQSKQLSPNQGGFGEGLGWSKISDDDQDFINDAWESKDAVGYTLGFEIKKATRMDNQVWRGNWDHGWITPETVKNPPKEPYCNPDGYNATTGSGLCPRNEGQVKVQEETIKARNWSAPGTWKGFTP